ncbi:unnamed protein product, partial [Iphiclides podalirius]
MAAATGDAKLRVAACNGTGSSGVAPTGVTRVFCVVCGCGCGCGCGWAAARVAAPASRRRAPGRAPAGTAPQPSECARPRPRHSPARAPPAP